MTSCKETLARAQTEVCAIGSEPLDAPPRAELLAWFGEFQRNLPWRASRDPYRVWISEVMLQQTRVAAVIPYYEKFLARFPDVQALAAAPEEEVLRLWSGLGYYSRARNLRRAAQQMAAEHGGAFPRRREEALKLAGIGDYTAAAILSIAYGEKLAALDGNVARVLARLDAVHGDLREPRRWRQLQRRADELLAREAPGEWNQALMELGATVCTPRAPQCLLCPLQRFCRARKAGIAEDLPEARKKRGAVAVSPAAAIFVDGQGMTLLLPPPAEPARVAAHDHVPALVAKLWHFPTVAVQGSAEESLRRHMTSALGVRTSKSMRLSPLAKVRHTVTFRKITVSGYLVAVRKLPNIPTARKLALEQVDRAAVSGLTRKLAKAAINVLGKIS